MMYAMNGVASKLVRTLAAVAEKKEKEPRRGAPRQAHDHRKQRMPVFTLKASWHRLTKSNEKGEDKWQHSRRNRFWTRSPR